MLHFSVAEEDLHLGPQSSLEQLYKPSAWTISIPTIKDRDIIVRYDEFSKEEWRYEVLNTTRIKPIFGKYARQRMQLIRLDKTDPRYQIKIS